MHLYIIAAYALLIWWSQERPFQPPVDNTSWTFVIIAGQVAALWVLARMLMKLTLRRLDSSQRDPAWVQHANHRHILVLRAIVLAGFAVDLTLTNWIDIVTNIPLPFFVPGLTGLFTITPFLIGTILVLTASYPVDRAIRLRVADTAPWETHDPVWSLKTYLEFHIRHSLLTVVIPTTLILICYDLATHFEKTLVQWFRIPYATDLLLGASACGVFLIAPWILKHVWPTEPLPDGPLRRELELMCKRVNLNCRDILVWKSGGMTVNAAVMGLLPQIRYVMLSDGLLSSMPDKQVEAVFGHEAGHVKHRHIQFFLLFAFASMLIAAGFVEILYRHARQPDAWVRLSLAEIQAMGFAFIMAIWAGAFGFISRRFERQADLFGARCVTPVSNNECKVPCGIHADDDANNHEISAEKETSRPQSDPMGGLCATGAGIFNDALHRVAQLNGIPLDEPSWRHSSLANRIDSLTRLASDPNSLTRFEKVIRHIKQAILIVCVVGTAISLYYIRIDYLNAASN